MNRCRNCNQDFGSVSAFDSHRVGSHEYTLSEGLKQDPPVEDGRRCLSTREMAAKVSRDGSHMFQLNSRGAWSTSQYLKDTEASENSTVSGRGGAV